MFIVPKGSGIRVGAAKGGGAMVRSVSVLCAALVVVALLAAVFAAGTANAEEGMQSGRMLTLQSESNSGDFEYEVKDGKATITKYKGTATMVNTGVSR